MMMDLLWIIGSNFGVMTFEKNQFVLEALGHVPLGLAGQPHRSICLERFAMQEPKSTLANGGLVSNRSRLLIIF